VDPLDLPQPTAIVVDNADRGEHLRSTESTGGPAARVGEGAVFGVSALQDTIIPSNIVVVFVLGFVDRYVPISNLQYISNMCLD